ncbi:MAG TPA: hypothetical protein VJS66_03755 [Burkholderiales bacterium]|nr:hypothetical protein [Burkholderiales bacterium]
MELNDVKQRIYQIKQVADRAIEACRNDKKVSQPLKESIVAFGTEANNAVKTIQQEDDEAKVEQCVDDLEEAADRAKNEAQRASGINEKTRETVLRAHEEVSQLKHQLH